MRCDTVSNSEKWLKFILGLNGILAIMAIVAVVTSVVAAFYYLNVVRYMFFEKAEEGAQSLSVSLGLKMGLAVTAAGILVIGIYPQPFMDLATKSMQMIGMAF